MQPVLQQVLITPQNYLRISGRVVAQDQREAIRPGIIISHYAFTNSQEWLGHAHISTTRIYDHRQQKPEESPTFRVRYSVNAGSQNARTSTRSLCALLVRQYVLILLIFYCKVLGRGRPTSSRATRFDEVNPFQFKRPHAGFLNCHLVVVPECLIGDEADRTERSQSEEDDPWA